MLGAGNETRTRDPNLGKVVLYQLSYSRCVVGAYCTALRNRVNPCCGPFRLCQGWLRLLPAYANCSQAALKYSAMEYTVRAAAT